MNSCFNYVSGENQELVGTVGKLLERDEPLSETVARRVYDEFLSPTRQAETVEEISSKLSDEIRQTMAVVHAAAGSSGTYDNSLEGGGIAHQ